MKIENVLLVDDDPGIRRVAEISLSRVGKWNVRLLDAGAKVLGEVRENRPDLILLDVMMPGMDGPSTFKLLQDHSVSSGIPVIFLTAKVLKQEMLAYLQLGAIGVVSKPFDPITLPSEILQVIATHERLAQVA